MILITYFLAKLIFMMYRDRFDDFDFEHLPIGTEVLLPYGVKFVKTAIHKYGVKYYASDMRDWETFKGGMELRLAEIIDDNTQIYPRNEPSVKDNEDGTASFVGELVGMGM